MPNRVQIADAAAVLVAVRPVYRERQQYKKCNCKKRDNQLSSAAGRLPHDGAKKVTSMTQVKLKMLFVGFTTIVVFSEAARAADTVEPFDVGATDFELYTGMEGLGRGKYEKTVYGDVLLGYGLLPRLSAYAGMTLHANEYFADGAADFAIGMYGTVVDTHHFDLELFLDFAGGGDAFSVTPSFEMNVDADPEMQGFGVYVRGGVPMYGRDSAAEDASEPTYELATQVDGTVGTYLTLNGIHQLLLEYDMVFRPDAMDDEHSAEVGGIALGYNVLLTDSFELINQVVWDIPQENEQTAFGVSTGILVTLPAVE